MESDKYTQVLWSLKSTSESWAKEKESQNTHVTGSGKCPRKPSWNSWPLKCLTRQQLFLCSSSLKLLNCQCFNVPSMPFSHLQPIKFTDSSAHGETCSNTMEAKRLNLIAVQSGHEDLVANFTGKERTGGWDCSKINCLTKHLVSSFLLVPFWTQLFVPVVRFTLSCPS